MDSAAKRQRAGILARDVEPVGLGIDGWIAIGGSEKAEDRLVLLDFGTANGHVF